MGGSLALALREAGFSGVLLGAGGSAGDLEQARSATGPRAGDGRPVFGAVHGALADLPLEDLDLVVLAIPPAGLESCFGELAGRISARCLVTDLASVKGPACAAGRRLLGARHLGSHPLVGSERHGFAAASAALYRGSRCVLTPVAGTGPHPGLAPLRQFWEALGCGVLVMDPGEHDQALAATSHLPHLLAFAYMAGLDAGDGLGELAGGGLRDFSRIAASDPALWPDILLQNRTAVRERLHGFRGALDTLDALLGAGDGPGLRKTLALGRATRQKFRFPQ